jgi:hypothetical protein
MTRSDFGMAGARPSIVHALWVAITLAVLWLFGLTHLAIDRLGEIGATLVALVIIFSAVFIVNLLKAPQSLQQEAEAEIAGLRKQLNDREAKQAAINVLWSLRSSGISMRNDRVSSEDEFNDWQGRFWTWRTNVIAQAGLVDQNLQNWLDRLDRTQPPPLGHAPFNAEHERLVYCPVNKWYLATSLDRRCRDGSNGAAGADGRGTFSVGIDGALSLDVRCAGPARQDRAGVC